MTVPSLRGYQVNLVDRLRDAFRAHRRVLCVLPTGGGKTVVAGHLARNAQAKGSRTLFLAHRSELIEQASAKLTEFDVPHGIIKAHHPRRDQSQAMQVASVQTLARRLGKPQPAAELWGDHRPSFQQPYDLVIIDECHHVCAGQYQDVIAAYPNARVLGLTATPYRLDGQGLGEHFDELVIGAHVPDLIAAGWLVPTRTLAPSSQVVDQAMAKLHTRAGEFAVNEADDFLNATGPIEEVLDTWRTRAGDRLTVGFACSVSHANRLAEAFRGAGIAAAAIDGGTPGRERDEVLGQLRAGVLRVVFNCQLLTEGWDLPAAACAILARPTKSRALWRQMCGRVMRSHPGKVDGLIIDHAANALRFGIPDEADHYSLQVEDRDAPQANVQKCLECKAIVPETLAACPECACVLRRVGHGGGGRGVASAGPNWTERGTAALGEFTGVSEADREAFYRKLLKTAREKKYADGWAAYRFKDRFGKWPANAWRQETVSA